MDASTRTLPLGPDLDVGRRLADLRAWTAAWREEDRRLRQRLDGLDPNRRADVLLGSQIGGLRRQAALRVARRPILLDPDAVRRAGFAALRARLTPQYARLGAADRQLWLTNFAFLL